MMTRRMSKTTFAVLIAFAITGILLLISGVATIRFAAANAFRLRNQRYTETIVSDVIRHAPGDRDALDISTANGAIDVFADDVDDVSIVTVRTARGPDPAAARTAAEAVAPVVRSEDGVLVLEWLPPDDEGDGSDGVGVSWHVTVPIGTRLTARTDFGDVEASGPLGGTSLRSDGGRVRAEGARGALNIAAGFGDVEAVDIQGGVVITATGGSIAVRDVAAGREPVLIETEFGNVSATGVSAGQVRLASRSGAIHAVGLEASGALRLASGFGDITLEGSSGGDLTVETRGGAIRMSDSRVTGPLDATTDFGDIDVEEVVAESYDIVTKSGSLTLDGVAGEMRLISGFGAVTVTRARSASPNISTESGSITFSGSLAPDAASVFRTAFGDIEIRLPPDSAFDVMLESGFGGVSSDLPLLIEGRMEAGRDSGRIEGRLGRGGPVLEATSDSGSVRLLELDTEE